jgi:hypothetical protein
LAQGIRVASENATQPFIVHSAMFISSLSRSHEGGLVSFLTISCTAPL